MTQKRRDHPAQEPTALSQPMPPAAPSGEATPGEGGMTWLWRISGGILLLAAALIAVAGYQNMDNQMNRLRDQLGTLTQELHRDLDRLGENNGAMIKKDDHSTRLRTVWDSIKEMSGDHTDLTRVKERCAILQEMAKGNEEERRQMAEEVRRLRESQAGDGDKATLTRELRDLRERLAQIEGKRSVHPVSHQAEAMPALRPVGTTAK
jgi:DNA repair ATPase RecN